MSGEKFNDNLSREVVSGVEPPKAIMFFRNLFRGQRNERNGDSNLRETIEELIEQHEEGEQAEIQRWVKEQHTNLKDS